MNFANYLKNILEQHSLKAADVHKQSGLAQAHISMFLSGKRYPSASSILILASALSELTEISKEALILGILNHIEMDFTKGVNND